MDIFKSDLISDKYKKQEKKIMKKNNTDLISDERNIINKIATGLKTKARQIRISKD